MYVSGALVLFALNLWICWRLLFIEYLPHFVSLEPVFFALAKAIRSSWPHLDLGWWRQWYCGMPFTYTYQPLLHAVVAAVSGVTSLSVPRAFHIVLAVGYALGPVSLYALMLRLSRRMDVSLTGGLLYSLWSPAGLLISGIRRDIGGLAGANRLHSPVVYADSPHMFGLTLLPLAVLLLDCALEKRTPVRWIVASLGMIAVLLTNIPAAISLAMALGAYGLAAERGDRFRTWTAILSTALTGYLLAASFLPPSGLWRTVSNVQSTYDMSKVDFKRVLAICLVVVALILIAWALRRLRQQYVRFAVLFTFLTMSVVLAQSWFNVSLLAQATRFHLVMEMAIVMALVSLIVPLMTKWRTGRIGLAVVMAVFCWVQIRNYRASARSFIYPAGITARSEYKIARWMDINAHGARVFVPGSVSFWLNWLTDTPQVIGCCEQNTLLQAPRIAHWMALADRGAENSIAWFRALGVRYVAACGPGSTEHFRAMRYPNKFDDILPLRWRDGDDAIFEIPGRSSSLAHVVAPADLISRAPAHGADLVPFERYLAAIESPAHSDAVFAWESNAKARIECAVQHGEVVSVQIPYHFGWSAAVAGKPVRISQDALGLMAIDPACDGPCSITLTFTGGFEAVVLRVLMILAWTVALLTIMSRYLARRNTFR